MNDDWRLRIRPGGERPARELGDRLRAGADRHEVGTEFHDRVIVSVDGDEVFAYTGTREQAEEVERLIRSVADERGWALDAELTRWHPASESWEPPDKPLPATDADRAAEHAQRVERERAESAAQGYPEYEVRIECRTRGESHQLAEVLRRQQLPVVQRWHVLLVGAADEDTARQLADRITQETPPGTTITVEATLAQVSGATRNPFAVLGGLGG